MDDLTCSNETMMPFRTPINCTNMSVCEKQETNINMYVPMSMMVTGMVGNLAALLVLYTLSKDIQKTVYFPLLSGLAWSDLIGQALTSPIPILVYSKKIVLGGYLCMFNGFIMVFFGLLTPLLVCVLSLERMLSLRFTYYYHRIATIRKARLTVFFCCLLVLLFCCLPFLGFGNYSIQFPCTWCFLKFHRKKDSQLSAYAIMFGFINLVLIAAMVVFNVIVVSTLLHMRRQRKVNTSPSSSIKRILPPTPAPSVLAKLKIEMEIKMVWFLCCVTAFFLICWVPLNVHILESQLTNKTQSKKDLISVRLASINQIIDPWLYILLRGNLFRKIFNYIKNIFPRKRKRSLKVKSELYKSKPPFSKQLSRSNKISYREMCCLTSRTDDTSECVRIKSKETSTQPRTVDCKDIESNVRHENTDQQQYQNGNSNACLSDNSYQMISDSQLEEGNNIATSSTYPCISNTTNGLPQLPDSKDLVADSKYSNRKSL